MIQLPLTLKSHKQLYLDSSPVGILQFLPRFSSLGSTLSVTLPVQQPSFCWVILPRDVWLQLCQSEPVPSDSSHTEGSWVTFQQSSKEEATNRSDRSNGERPFFQTLPFKILSLTLIVQSWPRFQPWEEVYPLASSGHLLTREPRWLEWIPFNPHTLGRRKDEFFMNKQDAVTRSLLKASWAGQLTSSEEHDISSNLLGRVMGN